ncbi:hypothetical protein Nepgr_005124 [Nepenthes gracilis]|uniref:Uncharacterized protein n=1 Tax=Nepenthes gracilis TaxID=150966 RepID=A0AAD3XG17_NEPGR|nr:hypothetical protein Nepgr_005124 [Nepenthes gracilis]
MGFQQDKKDFGENFVKDLCDGDLCCWRARVDGAVAACWPLLREKGRIISYYFLCISFWHCPCALRGIAWTRMLFSGNALRTCSGSSSCLLRMQPPLGSICSIHHPRRTSLQ